MNATPNRNTALYRDLILDIVRGFLHESSIDVECRLNLSDELPYGGFFEGLGYESLKIEFNLGWDGFVMVEAIAEDVGIIQWTPTDANESTVIKPIMNIGGLHKALYDFHVRYVRTCSRQLTSRRGGPARPYMSGSSYFADLCVSSYLDNPKLVIHLADDEIRINQHVFRTGRAWRKDVRASVGLAT